MENELGGRLDLIRNQWESRNRLGDRDLRFPPVLTHKDNLMSLALADVRIISVENAIITAEIRSWDTFNNVQIPNTMLTDEFVTDLNIHLNANPDREYRVNAMLNLGAETVDELFNGAYFTS